MSVVDSVVVADDVSLRGSVTSLVKYYYHDLWDVVGDPRAKHYPLMSGGPWPTLALIFAYVYFVKVAGPRFMKDRPAYDLRGVIRLYNIVLVAWNLYFFYYFALYTSFGAKTWVSCITNFVYQLH